MKKKSVDLETEAKRATEMLKGKEVQIVRRHRPGELCIQFVDGTRLFVDHTQSGVELSISEGSKNA